MKNNSIKKQIIEMPDGYQLSANIFKPDNAHTLIVICSAAGVPQYYYYGIAMYLSQKGYAILTYDCRGIGESAPKKMTKKFEAGIKQLNEDFDCLIDFTEYIFPTLPIAILGHSLGGILVALSRNNHRFEAVFTVGTQMAYYKDWGFSGTQNFKIYFLWHIFLPYITRFFGYFPGKKIKLGIENLPASFVRDVHNRRKYPDIFNFLSTIDIKSRHLKISCPVMAMTMCDDEICTPQALNRFFDELSNAKLTKQIILLKETNGIKVGHLGFFKRKFADTLWVKVGNWFDEIFLEQKNRNKNNEPNFLTK